MRPLTTDQVRAEAAGSGAELGGAVGGLAFSDAAGSDLVVLRAVPSAEGRAVYAEQLVRAASGAWRSLRTVTDGVQDCPVDITAEFLLDTVTARDEDGDGTGEVTLVYRTACRGDVSAADQVLVLLEGGEQYALRGRARSPFEPDEAPVPEPAGAQWPAGTYAASLARWTPSRRSRADPGLCTCGCCGSPCCATALCWTARAVDP